MRLSRTRSIALATAAAVTAAGVVAPSALAQEETAPDAETAAVSESAAPESESETPAADESESESESESAPEDEPETEAPATAAKVSIEIKADKTQQSIPTNLEENDEVAAALAGHANVGWKDKKTPLGMKFSPVTATVTINPNTLRDKNPQTFVATDLDTGETLAEVTVNVTGVADTPINPGDKPKKTTPKQVAIIVGVAAAIAATLAGMVQFLVPGGWQHVISYFSGQR